MHIQVKLYSHIKRHAPNGRAVLYLDMPKDSTVADVMKHLQLHDQVPKIILVHGRPAQMDTNLSDEDVLVVFPVAEGG